MHLAGFFCIHTIAWATASSTTKLKQSLAGIQFRLTIPGEGTVLMDVGRLVFDADFNITFEAGQHPVYYPEEGAFEKLCVWFAE